MRGIERRRTRAARHGWRAILWQSVAIGAVFALCVWLRLAQLEQHLATRAGLVIFDAALSGMGVACVVLIASRAFGGAVRRSVLAGAAALAILFGLPGAMAVGYALYDRTWLGNIDEEARAEGPRGLLVAHAAAIYLFTVMGPRLVFSWPAPLAALLGAAIVWRQRR